MIDSRIKKLALTTAAFFLFIVAVLLNAHQMYLMAIVVAVVPAVSWLLGYGFASGLQCERILPQTCSVLERVKVRLRVRNPSIVPRFFLRLSDRLSPWIRFCGSSNPNGPVILNLWAGAEEEVAYYIEPVKRGLYRIGPLRALSSDPIGFWLFRSIVQDYADLLVYPQVLPVRPDFLEAGGGRGWQDQESAQSRGHGTDFDGVREYRSGDELRRINWKATARTGTLAVTEYTQGYASAMVIALDTNHVSYANSGSGLDSALEYGVVIAASIAGAALRCGSPVSLVISDDISMVVNPVRGIEHLPMLLDMLARAEATTDARFSSVLDRSLKMARPGTLLVAISPEDADDADLRSSLEDWTRPPVNSSLSIFWLDRRAFQRARDDHGTDLSLWRRPSNQSAAGGGRASLRSRIGREFFVGPNSDLTEMLHGNVEG